VASDGVLHNLLEKKLITIKGRANGVGRPLLYGTTDEFLKFFGLNQLQDLPRMSEIEELIKGSEPEDQPMLQLGDGESDEHPVKLNIADGTYDPSDQTDEDATEPPADISPEAKDEESGPDDDDQDADENTDDIAESTETADEHEEHRIIVDVDAT
jgi:segregation and condensation protein B